MRTNRRELARELREHPFLQGLDPGFLDAIEGATKEREFATGDPVIREGEPAGELILVLQGKIGLELVAPDRPRLSLLTVGPGEIVGWSWLLPPRIWQVDGRALKATRVLTIDGNALLKVLEDRPKDAYRFMLRLVPVISRRLQIARIQVMDIHAV